MIERFKCHCSWVQFRQNQHTIQIRREIPKYLDNPKTRKVPNPTKIKGETDVQIHNKIEKAMSSEGRYHIGINYNDKTGHIITAERIGDSILYYDAQSGKKSV